MDGGNEAFILFCVSVYYLEGKFNNTKGEKQKNKITCNFQTFSTRLGTFDQKRD
jgi:hypothetical protein